jgi:hypothetical protein
METNRATAADGELTLRLYDLRREPELRKARDWFNSEFWPRNYSEVEQIAMNFGSPQNRWFGQVLNYWETAAALVARGAYHPGLFYDTCHEAWFCYAKIKPYLQEARSKYSNEYLTNLEKAIEGTAEGRARLQHMEKNIAHWREMSEQGKKKQKAGGKEAA